MQKFNFFSDDELFKKKEKSLAAYINVKKYDKCNDTIKEFFELSPHAGLTLYFLKRIHEELKDPSKPSTILAPDISISEKLILILSSI